MQSGPFTMEDAPETAAQLAQLHRAIVADRDYIRTYQPNWDSDEVQAFSHTLHLIYHLKNGKIVERYYDLWLEAGRVETPGTYDNLLAEFYSDPAVILESVSIPGDARLEAIDVIIGYMENGYASTSDRAYGGDLESRQIYAAILEDAAAGRVPARNVISSFKDIHYSFCLELEYLVWEEQSGAYYGHRKTVFLAPSMTSTTSDNVLATLETEAKRAKKHAVALATALSEKRASAGAEFSAELRRQASTLGMPNLRCEISLTRGKLGPDGFDQVQFLFAFNKNQALMPHGGAASGGEVSRLMLTVRTILTERMHLPSIIFDEVDTGVSGDVAGRMARMMAAMSRRIQVITITHLPGVAAMGKDHFKVYKEDDVSLNQKKRYKNNCNK